MQTILSNKYVEILIFDKNSNNSLRKRSKPVGLTETHKAEVRLPVFYLNLKYTRSIFCTNPNLTSVWIDRSTLNNIYVEQLKYI